MNVISLDYMSYFWSKSQIEVSFVIMCNIAGALLLGMLIGFERAYHGRAAGMRTYGLVCMSSSAVTVIIGYVPYWFGGVIAPNVVTEPTHIIQGILTGIGFLGAGVIMKEGLNITGLTTAALIWLSAVVGILCGAGFYLAAILLALLASATMILGNTIEKYLPTKPSIHVRVCFQPNLTPDYKQIKAFLANFGYQLTEGSIRIIRHNNYEEWHYVLVADNPQKVSIPSIVEHFRQWGIVDSYQIGFTRN